MIKFKKQLFMLSFGASFIYCLLSMSLFTYGSEERFVETACGSEEEMLTFEKVCTEIMKHPEPNLITDKYKDNESLYFRSERALDKIHEDLLPLFCELYDVQNKSDREAFLRIQKAELLRDLKIKSDHLEKYYRERRTLVKSWQAKKSQQENS